MKTIAALAAVIMAVCAAPVVANAVTTVPLLAGQDDPIGTVDVWNDGTTVNVVVSSTVALLEVHVHVAATVEEIPQTKKGNPTPGQFDWSATYNADNWVDGLYVVPFAITVSPDMVAPCGHLAIAVHAATGKEESKTLVSGDGGTVITERRAGNAALEVLDPPVHAIEALEPWVYPQSLSLRDDALSLWDSTIDNVAAGQALLATGADWIWEPFGYALKSVVVGEAPVVLIDGQEYVEGAVVDPIAGTALTFERTFEIGEPIDGQLYISCDNGYDVSLNGLPEVKSSTVHNEWFLSNLTEGFLNSQGWQTPKSQQLQNLHPGTNVLSIDAGNEYYNSDDGNNGPGTVLNNPGGLIYALVLNYYSSGETAWADGPEFKGKNWATYIDYTVPCKQCIDLAKLGTNTKVDGETFDGLTILGSAPASNPLEVVQSYVGTSLLAYNSPGGTNGCFDEGYAIGNYVNSYTPEDITFSFAEGRTASSFTLKMYDYGDWFPVGTQNTMHHKVTLTAYNDNGDQVSIDTLTFTSTGSAATQRNMTVLNGTTLSPAVNLGTNGANAGDACGVDGLDDNTYPGQWVFTVTGTGITTIHLDFVDVDSASGNQSLDPGVAFGNICYTLE